ncbi:ATP-binding cassette domain-containing protein [Rhodobacteraceae bacterium]|nr:ATP-binding cassette domain-containing protein [Paracoccaceae bacterium]
MADTLDFRIKLSRGELFSLDVAESFPLSGITAIVGPSGGGKTTFLRALAGLEKADDARVRFRNKDWTAPSLNLPPEKRRIGFVFQNPSLFPHLDVAGNLRYGARRREIKSYDAIIDALDLGVLMSRRVQGLSGGEARRVALGRAMASNPDVLFLDEPLSGLDTSRKAELLPYIGRAVSEAQVPALYVTHSASEVTTLADRVIGLSGGSLTEWQVPPARLRATVTSVSDGVMSALVDGAEPGAGADFALPVIGKIGETIGLGLPNDSVLVSTDPPGRSDALATLPARVVKGEGGLSLDIFGQKITLPKGGPYAVEAKLWVSILRILPRPEPIDSADIR